MESSKVVVAYSCTKWTPDSYETVVDTSIFIDYLRAKDKKNTELFKIPDDHEICISSITLYELLIGAASDKKFKDIQLLTEGLEILSFDENVSIRASQDGSLSQSWAGGAGFYLTQNFRMIQGND